MASQPYTDADVDQLTAHVRAAIGWPMSAGEVSTIVTAVLQALSDDGRIIPANDPRHIIEFRATGWTLKHPLSCRHGDLWGCAVNRAAEEMDGPPAEPGRYAVHVDGIDGRLWVDERVEG